MITPLAARAFVRARFAFWMQTGSSHALFRLVRQIEDCDATTKILAVLGLNDNLPRKRGNKSSRRSTRCLRGNRFQKRCRSAVHLASFLSRSSSHLIRPLLPKSKRSVKTASLKSENHPAIASLRRIQPHSLPNSHRRALDLRVGIHGKRVS